MEMPPEETGKIGTSSDTILRASLTELNNSRSSHPSPLGIAVSKKPLHAYKTTIFSDAIFDDSFEEVIPIRPTSPLFGSPYYTQDFSTASAESGQTIKTASISPGLSCTELEIEDATDHKFDELSVAEAIDTAPAEIGETAIIFATMLDLSFQDTEGKWQAYC
jgi:hypothetical protein